MTVSSKKQIHSHLWPGQSTSSHYCSVKNLCALAGQSQGDLKQTRFLGLTQWGNVSLWSVHVLASSEDAAGVQADAGLQFGGHVRLLLLAASLPVGRNGPIGMQISQTHKLTVHMHATTLALLPQRHDQFIVAGDSGQILRGSLYGQAPVPKVGCCKVVRADVVLHAVYAPFTTSNDCLSLPLQLLDAQEL